MHSVYKGYFSSTFFLIPQLSFDSQTTLGFLSERCQWWESVSSLGDDKRAMERNTTPTYWLNTALGRWATSPQAVPYLRQQG